MMEADTGWRILWIWEGGRLRWAQFESGYMTHRQWMSEHGRDLERDPLVVWGRIHVRKREIMIYRSNQRSTKRQQDAAMAAVRRQFPDCRPHRRFR